MQVTLDITEKQLDILKELVTHIGAHNVVMAENFVKYYKEDKDVC